MSSAAQAITLYFLVFCCAFLALNAAVGAGLEAHRRRNHTNVHAKKKEKADSAEVLLASMRRDRGLSKDGHIKSLNYAIGKMVMQSGLPLRNYTVYGIMFGAAIVAAFAGYFFKAGVLYALIGAVAGLVLPILIINHIVKRRRKKAAAQLPDALDVIIRSLKAGHPVSVALKLVGDEMQDPLGSEFAVASDEVGFGGTVSGTIQRMADRIGQEDFDLFAAMIRLQEKTGGNLAELLEANAATIRSRQRLRLKVRAASSEGRMSAIILNAAPAILFVVLMTMAPDFYGDVQGHPAVTYGLWGIVTWMAIGNLIMRKMINFKM